MSVSRIAVVVLTWNSRHYTLDCLQSVARQTQSHTLYVVDNASTDGTPELIQQYPSVHLIRSAENLGYAAGNNLGLAAAFADGADAALVLNNDATLAPDALAHLASAADMHPAAGILNPVILFAHAPHHVWFAGAGINRWTGQTRHYGYDMPHRRAPREVRTIERATGCAMLITRACYDALSGFDERLFLYYEDAEYSLRARRAGFSILLVPQAIVYHHISASSGGMKSPSALYYSTRNSVVVLDENAPLRPPFIGIRRLLIVLAMLLYSSKPPRGAGSIRDIAQGYRDARNLTLGLRTSRIPRSPYFLRRDTRGAHMRLLALMPRGERVLDVGCASGYLAELLQERGYRVTGVEPDPDAATQARQRCEMVYEESAERLDRLPLPSHSFDITLFGDVLEHLAHPERALAGVHTLLAHDGAVVISVPNVAHYSVRLRLFAGRFTYTPDGLLDATHLRFFTRQSIIALARSSGFAVARYDVTQGSPLRLVGHLLRKVGREQTRPTRLVDACDLFLSRRFPGLFGYQHLLVLRPQHTTGYDVAGGSA
ncbi:MAG: methyltransferase domain-containing protein [Thermomicrobia bacterium]|nr:methyltransferase domain-containing protein [Thermomicrobia bacterium]MCA1724585.1 methyltransferase domain-containing protein [Thermomicrobia bacterium]